MNLYTNGIFHDTSQDEEDDTDTVVPFVKFDINKSISSG